MIPRSKELKKKLEFNFTNFVIFFHQINVPQYRHQKRSYFVILLNYFMLRILLRMKNIKLINNLKIISHIEGQFIPNKVNIQKPQLAE